MRGGLRIGQVGEHHLDEVRRQERRRRVARGAAARRAPRPPPVAQDEPRRSIRAARSLPRGRRRELRQGLKRDGRCGSPARNAACAGVSIDAGDAEVHLARAPGADDLVAVGARFR